MMKGVGLMGRCKNPGHRRWRIRKRDGVWQAFDPDGVLRYAAELHRMVLAFVLTQPKPKPSYVLLEPKDLGGATSWQEILRRALDHDPPPPPSDTKDTTDMEGPE